MKYFPRYPTDDEVIDLIRSVPCHYSQSLRFPKLLEQIDQVGILGPGGLGIDDFISYSSGASSHWTSVIGSGTIAVSDGYNGILTFTPTGLNNDLYIRSTAAAAQFDKGAPIYVAGSLNFTENTAGEEAIIFGLCSSVTAGTTIASGGLSISGSSYAVIWKPKSASGSGYWTCASVVNGGTVLTNTSSMQAVAGSTYQQLEVDVQDMGDGTYCLITYYVNKVQLKDTNTGLPIWHKQPVAGANLMQVTAGCLAGSSSDTMLLDWICGVQKRQ